MDHCVYIIIWREIKCETTYTELFMYAGMKDWRGIWGVGREEYVVRGRHKDFIKEKHHAV